MIFIILELFENLPQIYKVEWLRQKMEKEWRMPE